MSTTVASRLRLIALTVLVSVTFAWYWGGASLTQNRSTLFATILFVAFGIVLFGVLVAAVRCTGEAYSRASGTWSFHIGWFILALLLAGLAGMVIWILSGSGPIGLDQLPWLKLPRNIIGSGWRYGVVYLITLAILAAPRSLPAHEAQPQDRPVGGVDVLQRMMQA